MSGHVTRALHDRCVLAAWFVSYGATLREGVNAVIAIDPEGFGARRKPLSSDDRGNKDASSLFCHVCPSLIDLALHHRAALRYLILTIVANNSRYKIRRAAAARSIVNISSKHRRAEHIRDRRRKERMVENARISRLRPRKCMRCGCKIVSEYPGLCRTCRSFASQARM